MTGDDGDIRGSISRSKIAEDDECLFLISKNGSLIDYQENLHRTR